MPASRAHVYRKKSWERNHKSHEGGICGGSLFTRSHSKNSLEGIIMQKSGQSCNKADDETLVGEAAEKKGTSDIAERHLHIRSDTLTWTIERLFSFASSDFFSFRNAGGKTTLLIKNEHFSHY